MKVENPGDFEARVLEIGRLGFKERKQYEKSLAKEVRHHFDVLERLLHNEDVLARRTVIELLRRNVRKLNRALKILMEKYPAETDVKTRRRMAAAIGESQRKECCDFLFCQLNAETHRFVQVSLVLALGRLGFDQWTDQWLSIKAEDSPVGRAMSTALSNLEKNGPPSQEEILRPSGAYLFAVYQGLESIVEKEMSRFGLGKGQVLSPGGWLKVSADSEQTTQNIRELRTIIRDFNIISEAQVQEKKDYANLLKQTIDAINKYVPGGGLAFRLALPKMESKHKYTRMVKKMVRLIEDYTNWHNSPSHYLVDLRVLEIDSGMVTAWRHQNWEQVRKKIGREFVPASLHPAVAAALCIAAVQDENALYDGNFNKTMLDPCCGAGTILKEWLVFFPNARVMGYDISKIAIEKSEKNLSGLSAKCALYQGDMRNLPLADGSVDFIIANLPFGIRVKHRDSNRDLYRQFVTEAKRLLRPGGILVVYTSDWESMNNALAINRWRTSDPVLKINAGGLNVAVFRAKR